MEPLDGLNVYQTQKMAGIYYKSKQCANIYKTAPKNAAQLPKQKRTRIS